MRLRSTYILAVLLIALLFARDSGVSACPLCRLGAAGVVGTYATPSDFLSVHKYPLTTRPTSQPATPLKASAAAPAADDSVPAKTGDRSLLPLGLQLTGGTDVTNAYYHRGYLMSDGGVITQPYLTISRPFASSGLSVTPYVGTWMDIQKGGTRTSGNLNGTATTAGGTASMFCCPSSQTGGGNASSIWITPPDVPVAAGGSGIPQPGGGGGSSTPAASASGIDNHNGYALYEADIDAGVAINAGPFSLDVKYTVYTYPGGALFGFQEVGARLSLDLTSLWLTPEQRQSFLLRPFVEVEREVQGSNKGQYTYVEVGVEPSAAISLGHTLVGISLPVTLGLSGNGVYESSDGGNETFGYGSAALKITVPLPVPEQFGRWYISASATYLYLNADNLRALNSGQRNEVIGAVGIGFRL